MKFSHEKRDYSHDSHYDFPMKFPMIFPWKNVIFHGYVNAQRLHRFSSGSAGPIPFEDPNQLGSSGWREAAQKVHPDGQMV